MKEEDLERMIDAEIRRRNMVRLGDEELARRHRILEMAAQHNAGLDGRCARYRHRRRVLQCMVAAVVMTGSTLGAMAAIDRPSYGGFAGNIAAASTTEIIDNITSMV